MDLEKPKLRALTAFPAEVAGRPVLCLKDPEGISEHVATLSPGLVPFLFEVLDGEHTIPEIQVEFTRRSGGQILFREELETLLGQLDEALFLEGPRYEERVGELLAEYRSAPARAAVHAGQAYPADPDELRGFLDGLYADVESPPA
ncbi:MAG: AmmeMemoRadiSam system protein B, partial [Planctomycetota bacterium]